MLTLEPPEHPVLTLEPPEHPVLTLESPEHPVLTLEPPEHTVLTLESPEHTVRYVHRGGDVELSALRAWATLSSLRPPMVGGMAMR